MTTQPTQEAPMSDVTDLNALIERSGLSQWHLDNWPDGAFKEHIPEVRKALRELVALRTLAERQPVGDGEVAQADRDAAATWCAKQPFASKQAEAPLIRTGQWDHHTLVQDFARHRQAAEQRGADRAFEEAAGIARNPPHEFLPLRNPSEPIGADEMLKTEGFRDACKIIAAAIRQRIGGQ